jgi:predicted transcriptional regulator
MKSDVTGLNNPDFQEIEGTTGTKLDMIVQVILSDRGLLRKIPTSDLRAGSKNANEMNHLIIEAIKAEGLGNDGKLTTADIRTINEYLVTNHLTEWAVLHGDDEDGEETGFHRVQNDGATTRMYAANVMNSIADGIYHLGFKTDQKNRLVNEDGNKNKSFEKIAWWLDTSLKSDLSTGILSNPSYQEVVGETGTSLDKMIPYIYNNEGLLRKVSMSDIREGARTANEMNKLLVQAIRTTGVANDDYISVDDARTLNEYLVANNATEWATLHGDDEDNEETGYHRIQNDGATGTMHNRNTINNLADGIYHLGFESYDDKRLANEDGNKNVSFRNVSYWLNQSLKSDYASGVFK